MQCFYGDQWLIVDDLKTVYLLILRVTTFKHINGYYDLTVDTFLNLMMLEEEDIAKSYSSVEADWI